MCSLVSDPHLQPGDGQVCRVRRQLAGRLHLHQPEGLGSSPAGVWKQGQEVRRSQTQMDRTHGSCTWAESPNNGNTHHEWLSLSQEQKMVIAFSRWHLKREAAATCSGKTGVSENVWEVKAPVHYPHVSSVSPWETKLWITQRGKRGSIEILRCAAVWMEMLPLLPGML